MNSRLTKVLFLNPAWVQERYQSSSPLIKAQNIFLLYILTMLFSLTLSCEQCQQGKEETESPSQGIEKPSEQSPSFFISIDPELYFKVVIERDEAFNKYLEKRLSIYGNYDKDDPQLVAESKKAADEFSARQVSLLQKYNVTRMELEKIESDEAMKADLNKYLDEHPEIRERLNHILKNKRELTKGLDKYREIPINFPSEAEGASPG